MGKPKVLCLHGFGESAELFKIRSRNLRALVGDHAELVYPDAPIDVGSLHMTTSDLADAGAVSGFTNLSWWWLRRGKTYEARGMGESLALLGKILNEQGPFDGIVGFSQGASLAVLVCALLAGREGPLTLGDVNHPQMKFAILAGAFQLEMPIYEYVYAEKFTTPSLHIRGIYDTVVSPERSLKLQHCFESPDAFEFVGGHFIPQSPQCARKMRAFLAPFIPGLADDESQAAADSCTATTATTDSADSSAEPIPTAA
ncbi:Ovarian cancer-associated protein 2 [Coemansia biformis]|uniref:Ovarian cancer-associated protein 2 n=1 Tax=Coemansia biformis TaxID=1286918 RepID=A0A9W7YF10_9FUNG|nr:Ovarian cancer-associated protein 2 [Coemansia biformis]